ncbi:helix-turn-helix transcriptional regulator [Pseudoalteromonas luteoviolacea]|nr:helix-turn-helix transcriptional regulator [Pseudoalteromonas luteoviolacea]
MRRELKLSQHELARKMVSDVDQSTISNWESGKSDIPLSKFIDILLLSSKDPASYFDSLRGKKKDDTEEVPE